MRRILMKMLDGSCRNIWEVPHGMNACKSTQGFCIKTLQVLLTAFNNIEMKIQNAVKEASSSFFWTLLLVNQSALLIYQVDPALVNC